MKRFVSDFLYRGLMACGFGPIVLAVVYLILHRCGVTDTLSVEKVCIGIFSITFLAFVAGGMNALYQIERLPLMVSILVHGTVLYISYLATYLVNGWLEWGSAPLLVFTGIFVVGYFVIWAVIYCVQKRNTKKLNEALKKKYESKDGACADIL